MFNLMISVLRAKGDTTGRLSAALAWKALRRPDTIVIVNASINALTMSDQRIGFGLSMTG